MRAIDRRLTPIATVAAATTLTASVLWPPVFGRAETAAGDGITLTPSTLGFEGTGAAGAIDCGPDVALEVGVDVGVVVGFETFVAPGGGAVVVLVVVVLVVVADVVGVVSATPLQSASRFTVMFRDTEPPPGTASVIVTVKDASDIGRPVAVPSILPCSKKPMACPTVMLDNVTPPETVSPVTVAGPG